MAELSMILTRAAARHRDSRLDLSVTQHHIRGVAMPSRSIRLKMGAVVMAALVTACVFAGHARADASSTPPAPSDGDAVPAAERLQKPRLTLLRAPVEQWR